MYCKLDQEHGPFDLIGDIHGCHAELIELLDQLGYEATHQELGSDGSLRDAPTFHHPQGRKAVFLGDLVDRGPGILNTLRVVHNMVEAGTAFCVIGNHDDKLLRKLKGRNVQISHGLENTLAEIEALPSSVRNHFERDVQHFLEALPNHYILDQSRLVIAHAGIKEELHGTATERTRSFALYGETTGQKDEYGLPVRGLRNIGARRVLYTGIHPYRNQPGRTIRLILIQVAYLAVSSPHCAIRKWKSCPLLQKMYITLQQSRSHGPL
jgi:protein phosphatase